MVNLDGTIETALRNMVVGLSDYRGSAWSSLVLIEAYQYRDGVTAKLYDYARYRIEAFVQLEGGT